VKYSLDCEENKYVKMLLCRPTVFFQLGQTMQTSEASLPLQGKPNTGTKTEVPTMQAKQVTGLAREACRGIP